MPDACLHVSSSTSQLVSQRLQSLESSLSSRRQVQASLQTSEAWLESLQDQIKVADCPVGPDTHHATTSLEQFEVGLYSFLIIIIFLFIHV